MKSIYQSTYNPQNEMFQNPKTKRIQLTLVKIQENRAKSLI